MLVICKFIGRKYIKSILFWLFIFSLSISQYLLSENPLASYYLIQSRGWEIMLGAILAICISDSNENYTVQQRIFHEFLAFSGVVLIVGSSIFLSNETMFPGLMALLPTIGAALIIAYAREGTFAAQILQLKGFVLIGLVSYSLYLWHQPVLALARIMLSHELNLFEILLLIVLIFLMAYSSWRWIETPFRNRQIITQAYLKFFIISGFLCVIALGNWGAIDGLKNRFAELYEAHPKLMGIQMKYECVEDASYSNDYFRICSFGDRSSTSVVALWGDSHAEMLASALDKKFKLAHIKGVRIQVKGCGPIPSLQDEDFVFSMRKKRKNCEDKYEAAYEFIRKNVQSTIVSIRWTFHVYPVVGLVDSMHFDNLEGGVEPGKSKKQIVVQADDRLAVDGESKKAAIHKLLQNLSKGNNSIIVVYPVPEVGWDVPRKILVDMIMGRQESAGDITTSHDLYIKRNEFINKTLDDWQGGNVYRIRPDEVFCQQHFGGRCLAKAGEVSYYSDTNHLSFEGALLVSKKIGTVFSP